MLKLYLNFWLTGFITGVAFMSIIGLWLYLTWLGA